MAARRFWRELYGIYLPQRKNVSVVPECLAAGSAGRAHER
jgi:hypothetical protein